MQSTIYILGAGAVGWTLAAVLTRAGHPVVAVRVSLDEVAAGSVYATIRCPEGNLSVPVETVSLSRLGKLDGLVLVTTKSYANSALAATLAGKGSAGPIVVLQNGLGVEDAFLAEPAFPEIYRGVLYVTAQANAEGDVTFRSVNPSPIGLVRGSADLLAATVRSLTTAMFPFRVEPDIQREAWRKTIINAVFNSLCPLLEADNGVFAREASVAAVARAMVQECLVLAQARGLTLTETELMDQIMKISRSGNGVLISTLQDLQNYRPTEIEFLNLALSRFAAVHVPPVDLKLTDLLGRLVLEKSRLSRAGR